MKLDDIITELQSVIKEYGNYGWEGNMTVNAEVEPIFVMGEGMVGTQRTGKRSICILLTQDSKKQTLGDNLPDNFPESPNDIMEVF